VAIQRKGRAPHSQNRRAAVYAVELINGSEERMCTVAVHTTKEQDNAVGKVSRTHCNYGDRLHLRTSSTTNDLAFISI